MRITARRHVIFYVFYENKVIPGLVGILVRLTVRFRHHVVRHPLDSHVIAQGIFSMVEKVREVTQGAGLEAFRQVAGYTTLVDSRQIRICVSSCPEADILEQIFHVLDRIESSLLRRSFLGIL